MKLKEKGLVIPRDKTAEKYLNEVGYYKLINGYRIPFMYEVTENGQKEKLFCENISINDIYRLFRFDQDLKGLLFFNLLEVETKIKARMIEYISKNFGIKETDYLDAKNYKPDTQKSKQKFIQLKNAISNAITQQVGKHKSITWYYNNYGFFHFGLSPIF